MVKDSHSQLTVKSLLIRHLFTRTISQVNMCLINRVLIVNFQLEANETERKNII